jgi:hypothetical protein
MKVLDPSRLEMDGAGENNKELRLEPLEGLEQEAQQFPGCP